MCFLSVTGRKLHGGGDGGLVAVGVQKMCDMKQSSIYIPVIQKPYNSTKFGYRIKFNC